MMQFPVGNTLFVVLEPGNIRKMREGQPLVLRPKPGTTSIGIVSTPDIIELRRRIQLPTSPEMLSAAIESCKDLPEIDRGAEPVTTAVTAAENTENQIALQLAGSAETGGEKAAPQNSETTVSPTAEVQQGNRSAGLSTDKSVEYSSQNQIVAAIKPLCPECHCPYRNEVHCDDFGHFGELDWACEFLDEKTSDDVLKLIDRPLDGHPNHVVTIGTRYVNLGSLLSEYLAWRWTCPESMRKLNPNFRSPSQNQTVSSGVEGAHEGITADKSVALAESSLSQKCAKCPYDDRDPIHDNRAFPNYHQFVSSLSSPPPTFRFCPNGYRSHVCFNGLCSVCGDPAVSEFPTAPPTPTERGAESAHSGKQNTADKSELLPTQLPKEK